jgi:hypothetical protein
MIAIVQALVGPSYADMAYRAIELRAREQARLDRRPLGARQKRLLTRLRRAKEWQLASLHGEDRRVARSLATRGLVREVAQGVFEAAR